MEKIEAQRISDRAWKRQTARQLFEAAMRIGFSDDETAQERAKSTVAIPVPTNATDLHKNWKEKKPRRVAAHVEQPAHHGSGI